MSEKDIELPNITPRGGGKDSKIGELREVYDSHIDGPPPQRKSIVGGDNMDFGKQDETKENKDETA